MILKLRLLKRVFFSQLGTLKGSSFQSVTQVVQVF